MTPAPQTTNDEPEHLSPRERLLTLGDVARFLGIPLRTMYRWRSRGQGPPGSRLGRHVRFRVDEVERWLEDHRETP